MIQKTHPKLSPLPQWVIEALGLVRFRGIQSGRNNKCMKKIMIW
jgi:hypothetical protein